MIAVFARSIKDMKADIKVIPENEFRYISHVNDIRGLRFTGAIYLYKWFENKEVEKAYYEFQLRYPDFKY